MENQGAWRPLPAGERVRLRFLLQIVVEWPLFVRGRVWMQFINNGLDLSMNINICIFRVNKKKGLQCKKELVARWVENDILIFENRCLS